MDLIVSRDGTEISVGIERTGAGMRVSVDGRVYEVDAVAAGTWVRSLLIGGEQHEVAVRPEGDGSYRVASAAGSELLEVLDPLAHLARTARGGQRDERARRVGAYMHGRVVAILVQEGESVRAGQGVVVLEAMKMENEIQAERDGVVRAIFVAAGQAVEGGDPLFELE